ncbi:MAG: hypothetical protein H8E34_09280 [Bacteroidetes bacterium]|nr:hypothetical protein [Bacteroidota bacterium]MBL6942873.1 hypothetical protein [Bacteroidales bacterium]
MKNIVLISFVLISLLISSCSSLIYFTEEIRDELYENDLDIEMVQFYNSDKIILKRNLSKAEMQIAKGTIRLENGQYFEEIIIPKKTKGVAVKLGAKYLKVAFEEGENRNLRFDINENSKYQISADSWYNNYGSIKYDTTVYYIVPGSNKIMLLVNKEYFSNFEKQIRIVKGRSVGR